MLSTERSAIRKNYIHKALFRIHVTFSIGFTCLTPSDYIMFVNPACLQSGNLNSNIRILKIQVQSSRSDLEEFRSRPGQD
jgi:hypothetical protein